VDEVALACFQNSFFVPGVDEASELVFHEGFSLCRLPGSQRAQDETGNLLEKPHQGKLRPLEETHERRHHGGDLHGVGLPEDLRDGLAKENQHRAQHGNGDPLAPLAEEADEKRGGRCGQDDVDDLVAGDDGDQKTTRCLQKPLDAGEKREALLTHLVKMQGAEREEGGLGGRKEARQKQAQSHQDKFECSVWVQALAYPG